jgi:argininosuccinate lyase
MYDVTLTRVKFVSDQDLDELEKSITKVVKDFEAKHKGIDIFANIEITSSKKIGSKGIAD